MNESSMEKAVIRLDRLERENRKLKRMVSGVFIGVAAMLLMGQVKVNKVPTEIEAQKFVLKDRNGNIGGAFMMTDDGAVSLYMLSKEKKARFIQMLDADGNIALSLYTENQKQAMELGVGSRGLPHIFVNDEEGKSRFSVTVDQDGATGLARRWDIKNGDT